MNLCQARAPREPAAFLERGIKLLHASLERTYDKGHETVKNRLPADPERSNEHKRSEQSPGLP